MPTWATHLIIPFLSLLLISKREHYKYVIALLPLAIIPDADVLFAQHRGLLHNIFIPLAILAIAYLWKSKRLITLIALFYLSSHIFMDIFNGGVALFYPIDSSLLYIDITTQLLNPSNEISLSLNYGFANTFSDVVNYKYNYIIFDSVGTGAIIFLMIAFIAHLKLSRKL